MWWGSKCEGVVGERLSNWKESSKHCRGETFSRFRLLWVAYMLHIRSRIVSIDYIFAFTNTVTSLALSRIFYE